MSQYQQRIGADRRVHHRFEDLRASLVELGENNNGIVLNISEGGMAILASEDLDENSLRNLRFQAPEFEHWMETAAEIAWISDSRKQAGIRFKGLSDAARTQLRAGISIATVRTRRERQAKLSGASIEGSQEPADVMPVSVVEEPAPDSRPAEARQEIETNTEANEQVIPSEESKQDSQPRSLNSPTTDSLNTDSSNTGSLDTKSPDTKPPKPFALIPGNARPSPLTPQKSALSEMRFSHLLAKSGVKLPSYSRDGSIQVSDGKWAAIAAIAIVASLLAFFVGWLLGDPTRIKLPH
jgi:PilZ domain